MGTGVCPLAMQVQVPANGKHEEEDECAPVPDWSNRRLPRQKESDVARAAQYFRHELLLLKGITLVERHALGLEH